MMGLSKRQARSGPSILNNKCNESSSESANANSVHTSSVTICNTNNNANTSSVFHKNKEFCCCSNKIKKVFYRALLCIGLILVAAIFMYEHTLLQLYYYDNHQQENNNDENALPISDGCASAKSSGALIPYCRFGKVCMDHEPEYYDDILNNDEVVNGNIKGSTGASGNAKECKTLWFSGFHENSCSSYSKLYSVALNSALENANDVLYPVLLLGRYGLSNQNSTELSPIGQWAESKGAKVIHVPILNFQKQINDNMNTKAFEQDFEPEKLQGAYMRMNIPSIIKQYNLYDIPGVCDGDEEPYAMWTDADVMFPNKITHQDIQVLKHPFKVPDNSNKIIMYGREFAMSKYMFNTGIAVYHINRFEMEFPKILQYLKDTNNGDKLLVSQDQSWLNEYFGLNNLWGRNIRDVPIIGNNQRHREYELAAQLPIYWNWKMYWKLEPSKFHQIKVIHFHGPKPNGHGAEKMATCDVNFEKENSKTIQQFHSWYKQEVKKLKKREKQLRKQQQQNENNGNNTLVEQLKLPLHNFSFIPDVYYFTIKYGICCDFGRTAHRSLQLFNQFYEKVDHLCIKYTKPPNYHLVP